MSLNDLKSLTKFLDLMMFTYKTNIFYTHKDMHDLSEIKFHETISILRTASLLLDTKSFQKTYFLCIIT